LGQKVKNQGNDDWDQASHTPARTILDSGAIRVALLFGSAAVAFTMILTPIIGRGPADFAGRRIGASKLDATATGSILKTRGYTVRRSVLQGGPDSVCIIDQKGGERGKC
jgi:hypothetical protein